MSITNDDTLAIVRCKCPEGVELRMHGNEYFFQANRSYIMTTKQALSMVEGLGDWFELAAGRYPHYEVDVPVVEGEDS